MIPAQTVQDIEISFTQHDLWFLNANFVVVSSTIRPERVR